MMNKDEKETRNNVNEVGKDNSNTANHNFDYIEQKPEHSRKALVMLGIALVSALVLVIGGACFVTKNATEVVAQSGLFSTENDKPDDAPYLPTPVPGKEYYDEVLTSDATGDYDTDVASDGELGPVNDEPVYTEQSIELELYEVSLTSEDILVEPSSEGDYRDGYYLLESDKVYTLRWDAAPLFFNDDAEVDTEITANSDYLIKEGSTGTITVTLRDYATYIDYVGELKIASISDNLGIEFCADECGIFPRGSWPYISGNDKRFDLYFYTSGKYVERESSAISSGAVGYYSYRYGVDGSSTEEYSVTKPAKLDEDDHESTPDYELQPKPMPMPTPDPLDTPAPPPTPNPYGK